MELLKDHIAPHTQNMSDYFTRNDYMMMLIGVLPSPLWPRRLKDVTLEEMKQFGAWKPCSEPPTSDGVYFLEGSYENFDDKWESAILPAWWHSHYKEWECSDGSFSQERQWMEIPWLPEIWEAAKNYKPVIPTREEILTNAERICAEIDKIFADAEHWNNNVRKPDEEPINPDPDGRLAKMRAGYGQMLMREKTKAVSTHEAEKHEQHTADKEQIRI